MTLRLLAVIACIVALILFAFGAAATGTNPKDIDFGLVALAAGVGFLALEGVSFPGRTP